MSESEHSAAEFARGADPTTPDEIRADIEVARAELAETVDALTQKLDVKSRATERAHELTAQVEPYRQQIIAGGVAAAVLLLIIRVRRARRNRRI